MRRKLSKPVGPNPKTISGHEIGLIFPLYSCKGARKLEEEAGGERRAAGVTVGKDTQSPTGGLGSWADGGFKGTVAALR